MEQGDVLVCMSANGRGGFYHEEIGNECQFLNDLLCWKSVQRKSQKSGSSSQTRNSGRPKMANLCRDVSEGIWRAWSSRSLENLLDEINIGS